MFNKQLPPGIVDFRDEIDAPRTKIRSKRKVRALTLSEEAYAGLQLLARMHNDTPNYGRQNSVSDLVERIGNFELEIIDPKKDKQPGKSEALDALRQRVLELEGEGK